MADYLEAEWWPCRPNSDVALMLGIAYTLVANDLHDKDFLESCCVGFDRFLPYLLAKRTALPRMRMGRAVIRDSRAEHRGDRAPDGGGTLPDRNQLVFAA